VVGKLGGITIVSLAAVRLGLGSLPRGVGTRQLMGGAALAGIGFTVSLFVADLAFEDPELREDAKVGVLFASALAAALGWALFRWAARAGDGNEPEQPEQLDPAVDPERDHSARSGRRAADPRGVRRLRVPVLRGGHRHGGRAARALRGRAALRLPPPPPA
jgi:hypothetical protein